MRRGRQADRVATSHLRRVASDARDRKQAVSARFVEHEYRHSFRKTAEPDVQRTLTFGSDFECGQRRRHCGNDRRLGRRGRHISEGDAVCGERASRVAVVHTLAERQHRREEVRQRPGVRAQIRASADHEKILRQRVYTHSKPLLKVGDFRLRGKRAARRVQEAEHAPRHGHHDPGRHERFDQRESRVTCSQLKPHAAFLVLTLSSSTSSGSRMPAVAAFGAMRRLPVRVTIT